MLSDDEIAGVVVWGIQRDIVEAIKHNDGEPAETLIAIIRCVVLYKRLEKNGSFESNARVDVITEDYGYRLVSRRVEQTDTPTGPIARWCDPATLATTPLMKLSYRCALS